MGGLDPGVARDIDQQVDRLLADLRGLPPPLPLSAVRELLRVDLTYYSTEGDSALNTLVHRIRVARHQVTLRPRLLLDVVRKLDLKALWLPDQRRILVDSELPKPKQRWAEGHEIIHSILPWHQTFTLGDRDGTIAHDCHQLIEAEANYGASRLLFMGTAFDANAADLPSDFDSIKELSKRFGNSLASTLWRYVTTAPGLLVGVVSESPFASIDRCGRVRHIFCSQAFSVQFGAPNATYWQSIIAQTVDRRSGGPCGEAEHVVLCCRREPHRFIVSCFNTQYAILTLARLQIAGYTA